MFQRQTTQIQKPESAASALPCVRFADAFSTAPAVIRTRGASSAISAAALGEVAAAFRRLNSRRKAASGMSASDRGIAFRRRAVPRAFSSRRKKICVGKKRVGENALE